MSEQRPTPTTDANEEYIEFASLFEQLFGSCTLASDYVLVIVGWQINHVFLLGDLLGEFLTNHLAISVIIDDRRSVIPCSLYFRHWSI